MILFIFFITLQTVQATSIQAEYALIANNQSPLYFHNHHSDHPQKALTYTEVTTLSTPSGARFNAYYIDQNSENVIILGHGFRSTHTDMEKTAALFLQQGYDLILFDYRWINQLIDYIFSEENMYEPYNTIILKQKEEVVQIVDYARSKKNYRHIIGLGECYSAHLFVLAQADALLDGRTLFTHLILDSCFYSVSTLIRRILTDPFLCKDSKIGGFPQYVRTVFLHDGGIWIISKIFELFGKEYALKNALRVITSTPILFIHGKDDKLVTKYEFRQLLEHTLGQKLIFETPFPHGANKEAGELYALICMQFIENYSFQNNALDTILNHIQRLPV